MRDYTDVLHEFESDVDKVYLEARKKESEKMTEEQGVYITIDGERLEVLEVHDYSYLSIVETDDGCEYYVARDSEHAGEQAAQYWRDMAENDKAEFRCIVGDDSLIAWALGDWGGPGGTKTTSLEEWFDLTAEYPEEQWASWDGRERSVDESSQELQDELDFEPTVAYRYN